MAVAEGFLDGLVVDFSPGLNVVIGERGTGKTSLIELLRFALGAEWITDEAKTRGGQQALAVLDGGVVTVTLVDGDDRIQVQRSATDEPAGSPVVPNLTVLAQNEIEAIAAQPQGRLRLIDSFRTVRIPEDQMPSVSARLKALTAEIQSLRIEVDEIDARIDGLQDVDSQLHEAVELQATAMLTVEATATQREQLESLQEQHSRYSAQSEVFSVARARLGLYTSQAQQLSGSHLVLDAWPETAGTEDLLAPLRQELAAVGGLFESALSRLETISEAVVGLAADNEQSRSAVDEEARALRAELNRLQEGAGAVTRRVDELRERAGQLSALRELRIERARRLVTLIDERDQMYRELDQLRDARYEDRVAVADRLNHVLEPRIRVQIRRSANVGAYVRELIAALRGSGLHYNRLAASLARELSPLELVSAVDRSDPDAIAAKTDLPLDRAVSLIAALRTKPLGSLLVVDVDDSPVFELLDGTTYKPSDQLSIGQRCTVVLSIRLTAHGSILLVDQPEDHLDNAFITSSLVDRLREREHSDQLIVTSHNPNIPVLGEADQLVVMGSDGSRAYKIHQSYLDDPRSVEFITSLMEGGADAFRRRAEFYDRATET